MAPPDEARGCTSVPADSARAIWPQGALHAELSQWLVAELGATRVEILARLHGPASDVEGALERARRLGWIVGVLSAAGGADLLRGRRERDGARWLLDALAGALAQRGASLPRPAGPVARLRGTQAGWELPWACAALLQRCAASGEAFGWSLAREARGLVLTLQHPGDRELLRLARAIEAALEGVRFATLAGRFELTYESALR